MSLSPHPAAHLVWLLALLIPVGFAVRALIPPRPMTPTDLDGGRDAD